MVALPFASAELAEQARAFSATIEAAKPRWLYCLGTVKRTAHWNGEAHTSYSEGAVKVCERIIGAGVYVSLQRFARLDEFGYEAAIERTRSILGRVPYGVGPLEAWHIGHVYFARVKTHPHVLKIGFSRRVRDRLEDIESTTRSALEIRPNHLKVGTMANERWWHDAWKHSRIDGEWFFDPHMADRTLPDFLGQKAEAA